MLKFGAICYFMHVFSLVMKMYFKVRYSDMKICKNYNKICTFIYEYTGLSLFG